MSATPHGNHFDAAHARALDRDDALAEFREAFFIDDPDCVYLTGNSLGRMPRETRRVLGEALPDEWGRGLVSSWGRGWIDLPVTVGEKVAPLVGAGPGQVVVTDSTSVNLFKLAVTALERAGARTVVVSDASNFPTDLYVLEGCVRLLGGRHTLRLVEAQDDAAPDTAALLEAIDETTALVCLSHVLYKSGALLDARAVTERAREKGAAVLWDLSHSAGVVPVDLDGWGVDYAVGCTYKYLNGGPGSPAFLYVRRDLQDGGLSPIQGWFGQHEPFALRPSYEPVAGIRRFLAGSPSIIQLRAMEPALDLVAEAGVERIRAKSLGLTSYMSDLCRERLAPHGFSVVTPADPARRGSQLTLRHDRAYRISRALIEEMKVTPDFREPDLLRLGLAPLYTSFEDVRMAVERIERVMAERLHETYSDARERVT